MNEVVIKVSNLSKAYRIGQKEIQHDTLGSLVASWVKSPLKNFKRLKDLADINLDDQNSDIFWALNDINFEVKRGEVLGIIGKNGAGKSTLLKILSRITEPSGGRVEIYGRVASLLEVGTGFNPELTGRENVYLNGTILGMTRKEIDSKFGEIIEFSGVEKFIDTPVKRYSSGMKVRLAFSVAAHLDPEVLIIDEVLAVGDAEFQKKCLGKMQSISSKEGRTVLFVSHNLSAVQTLCNKTIVLADGRIANHSDSDYAVRFYLENVYKHEFRTKYTSNMSNDETRISEIVLLNEEGFETNNPIITQKHRLVIRYRNTVENQKLNISISFFDEENNYVISSPSLTDGLYFNKPHSIGNYESVCTLPENIFNDKTYNLTVMLVLDAKEIVEQLNDIIQLNFVDDGKNRFGYLGKWSGVVRPILEWRTIRF